MFKKQQSYFHANILSDNKEMKSFLHQPVNVCRAGGSAKVFFSPFALRLLPLEAAPEEDICSWLSIASILLHEISLK